MKLIRGNVWIYALGFLSGRASIGEMYPFAIAFFVGAYYEKLNWPIAYIAIVLGIASTLSMGAVMKYSILLLLIVAGIKILSRKNNERLYVVSQALLAGTLTIVANIILTRVQRANNFLSGGLLEKTLLQETVSNGNYILLGVLEGVVVCTFSVILQRGIRILTNKPERNNLKNRDVVCIMAVLGVVLFGIPDTITEYIIVLEMVAFYLILYFSYRFGISNGIAVATICGSIMAYRSNNIEVLGTMVIIALACGIFSEFGRIGTLVGLILSAGIMGRMYCGEILDEQSLKGLISASILFLCTPAEFMIKINDILRDQENYQIQEELNNVVKGRLKELSYGFKKLEKYFRASESTKNSLNKEDISNVFDSITEKLCNGCEKCEECWKDNFYGTYKAASNIVSALEKTGGISEDDINIDFAQKCNRMENFLTEINRSYEMAKVRLISSNRIIEGKRAMAYQIGEIGQIIDEFSISMYDTVNMSKSRESKIIDKLGKYNILVKKVLVLGKGSEQYKILLTAKSLKGRIITTKETAKLVGEVLGKRLRPSGTSKMIIGRDYSVITLEEDTYFNYLTGVRRYTKTGENISGDNFSFKELSNGQMVMMLSDGMGSGEEAYYQSEKMLDLLEQLLEYGFKRDSSIGLINSLCAARGEGNTFTTLDISMANLYTGVVEFVKLGASTTFIKRDNWVETIKSTTLPAGILTCQEIDSASKKLFNGDMIIMISDGILDCLDLENSEEYIRELIIKIDTNSPQEMADSLCEEVLKDGKNKIKDDITVLTMGLWRK